MHFASAIYSPSFFISENCASIDSSRRKASEQQTATPAGKRNVFKVNNKEARTTLTMSLFFTLLLSLCILVSSLLTLNIFHILHDVKNDEIRALYCTKERKVSLTVCKLKCVSSRIYAPPPSPPRNIGPSNLSFIVLTGFYGI